MVSETPIMVFMPINTVIAMQFELLSRDGYVMEKNLYNNRVSVTGYTHRDLHDTSRFKFKELRNHA